MCLRLGILTRYLLPEGGRCWPFTPGVRVPALGQGCPWQVALFQSDSAELPPRQLPGNSWLGCQVVFRLAGEWFI